jgi:hypothetical protein
MHLPGLELREGVPPDLRAIVVMPLLLTSVSTIQEQIERLEVHHLSNSDDNFTFALLSDWGDSAAEHAACWPGFKITFHYRSSRYEISVENPLLATRLDGEMLPDNKKMLIPL